MGEGIGGRGVESVQYCAFPFDSNALTPSSPALLPGAPWRREQEFIRSEDAYLKLPRITMNNTRQRPVDFRKP